VNTHCGVLIDAEKAAPNKFVLTDKSGVLMRG